MIKLKQFDISWVYKNTYNHVLIKAPTLELAEKQFYVDTHKDARIIKIEELFVLRLKPEIAFSELAKFGLQYNGRDGVWEKYLAESSCYLCISEYDRIVYHENTSYADTTSHATSLAAALYDLIAAGLLEKCD